MTNHLELEDKQLEDRFDFQVSNISPLGSYSLTLKEKSRFSRTEDLKKFINLTNAITQSDVSFDRNIGKDCQDTRLYECLIQNLCAHFPTITFYTIDNDLQLTRCSEYETDRAILLHISERKLYVISSLKQVSLKQERQPNPAAILAQTCLTLSLSMEKIDQMIETQRNRFRPRLSLQRISNPRHNTLVDHPKHKSPTFRSLFRRQVSKAKHKWSSIKRNIKNRVSNKIENWKRSWKLDKPMPVFVPSKGVWVKPNHRGPRTPDVPYPVTQ